MCSAPSRLGRDKVDDQPVCQLDGFASRRRRHLGVQPKVHNQLFRRACDAGEIGIIGGHGRRINRKLLRLLRLLRLGLGFGGGWCFLP